MANNNNNNNNNKTGRKGLDAVRSSPHSRNYKIGGICR